MTHNYTDPIISPALHSIILSMPPGEVTHIWDVTGPKKSWVKGEYCVHWIIVNGRPTMFTFECLQDRESLALMHYHFC